MSTETQKVDLMDAFDMRVQFSGSEDSGPEPSVREMIVRYYLQAFDRRQAECLANALILDITSSLGAKP